ncbi:ATP-binding protein [Streptomyces pactum]|uniref:ATP-binding protein n=1 Tax=Streptomyces pactum TaxID=68249 RepID=A0ABS0NLE5_9ACTN|nr:ATP-binding protein [Streptomyces pactum]MBH5336025.1 ATP-binding protein [Streptomyces pactum]
MAERDLNPDEGPAPLREDLLHYTPVPGSVRLDRHRAARLVTQWGQPQLADDVQLLVGELAANALVHGCWPDWFFRLRLALTETALRIEVSDPRGDRFPEPRTAVDGDDSGRGLMMVEAVADRWGTVPLRVGKTVWVELGLAKETA